MDEDFQTVETWNMALAYFMRIDKLLTACTIYHMQKAAMKWYDTLMCLYKELHAKMSDKQRKEAAILITKVRALVFSKQSYSKNDNVPIQAFINFELHLRQVLEDKSMLTPKGDDPTMAYRNG